MAEETVAAFYVYLDRMPDVRKEALSLKDRFPEQEDVIREFLALAAKNGFVFSEQDFVQYLLKH